MIRMFQGVSEETLPGYTDDKMRRVLYETFLANGLRTIEAGKTITLADIPEVTGQELELKRNRYSQEGYHGSDMETSWLLRWCNMNSKVACSVLVVSDLLRDRPFEVGDQLPCENDPETHVGYVLHRVVQIAAQQLLK